jgi:hypothetical protein
MQISVSREEVMISREEVSLRMPAKGWRLSMRKHSHAGKD